MPFTDYRPATREDIAARYPTAELDAPAALLALKRYFKNMAQIGGAPEMCQGKAAPVEAYRVNGDVVFFFRLDEPIGDVTGYVLQSGEYQVPVAVRGDVLPALWTVVCPRNGGGKDAKTTNDR